MMNGKKGRMNDEMVSKECRNRNKINSKREKKIRQQQTQNKQTKKTAVVCVCWQLNTDLALIDTTLPPTGIFSFTQMGPYTLWSHTGGLFARSTTSICTSTVRDSGGYPLSCAIASNLYVSRYKIVPLRQTSSNRELS